MKTVALLGAGAVGAYFIWGMAEPLGEDFCVIASGSRKSRLEQEGLIINGQRTFFPVKTPEEAHGVDLLLVSVKYNALPDILPDIASIVDGHTAVISLINGVDGEDVIGRHIGMDHMFYAMMRISAERRDNDIFFDPVVTDGVFFGEKDSRTPTARVQEVLELMGRTRANHHFVPDIMRSIWIKYAGNVSNNLPQAIIGAGVGIYVVSSHAAYIAEHLWNEVAALAALRGIDVGPFVPSAWAGRKTSRFSTLQDLDNGRHTEIDMLAGTAIRLSQESGLSAPFCEFTYHAIKALEEKGDGLFNFQ